ncbi:Bug family tripartite tricarboxylate transporter substrate binding protein [Achromobacter spanius]|uniref:Bug family tripartite tricarboxylate transporter substrate binding protein n=1 Tax=Achromobacter spanius TaxID=217203 RepID=UPI00381C94D1
MKLGFSRLLALGFCLLAAGAASNASADVYPSKPIRLLVGFPPGGPTDIIARLIGKGLSEQLGQPVVVENRGGAGGVIAARSVATAPPDGYTLLVSVESSQTRGVALNKTMPYDAVKDFSYVAKIAKQRNLVVIDPKLPISDIKGLIAYAKKHPGELNYSGTYGATSHIGGALFDMDNAVKMTFVSYPGGAQPITDLIAGVVQVGFFTEATIAAHVKSGKLKALAIAAPERSPEFPDVPTLSEAGARPMELSPWFGLTGPSGMDAQVVKRLDQAISAMVQDKHFQEQLATIGAVPIRGSSPQVFQKDVVREIDYWKKFVVDANVPVN